jgi:hypothetical protein
MAVIDPDGMFGGDRMAKLSDQARLHWPWLYIASNGFSRIELNYRRIVARVYANFATVPTEEEFYAMVQEYFDQFLLFVYSCNGQMWGQWETSERYLPRHKTAKDHASPDPPAQEYIEWKERYAANKHSVSPVCATFSENFRKDVRGVGGGKGVGIGVGKALKPCASVDAPVSAPEPRFELRAEEPSKHERERWFDEQFWPNVWAKIGRGAARKAWMIKVRTPEIRDKVIVAARAQKQRTSSKTHRVEEAGFYIRRLG